MLDVQGYAAPAAREALRPFTFTRREPGAQDVLIDVDYCGICHSDIHQARDEWDNGTFPMVPGHEIVGRVARVGPSVTRFQVGDLVGVGCMVGSCQTCTNCKQGYEQFCDTLTSWTYNGVEQDGTTLTQGGYSTRIVVDERFVLRIPHSISPEQAAPLLCAGVTTYAPLRRYGVAAGQRVGVVGLGGLGHVAVKIAAAMGAEVTVFSTSESKRADATRLGAHHFVMTKNPDVFEPLAKTLDLIIDSVSAPHDINAYLDLLRRDGALVLVGIPTAPLDVAARSVISMHRSLAGSSIGGIALTQEMLDFCAEHGIGAEVEVISADKINEAYERTIRGDVRFRFVIDATTFTP